MFPALYYIIRRARSLCFGTCKKVDYLNKKEIDVKQQFTDFFHTLAKQNSEDPTLKALPKEMHDYMDRMVNYTVPGGKLTRGLAVVNTMLQLKENVTIEDLNRANALGWCIEYLQAYFLIADDLMDSSVMRRDQPCWYRNEDVKLHAVNDCIIVESHIYLILKRYFKDATCYLRLIELFHEVTYLTQLGQLMDLRSLPPHEEVLNLDRFTDDLYLNIITYKTAFYTFYLSYSCAFSMCGITDQAIYDDARQISILMGQYFQIQDDYLDCFHGTVEEIGKVGRDIEEAKCCWPVVTALKQVSDEDRQIIQDNYGKDDAEAVNRVKAIYAKLDIKGQYASWEAVRSKELTALINGSKGVPPQIYHYYLDKLRGRNK